jgi:hypothetical protein
MSAANTNQLRSAEKLELTGTVWDSRNWSCAYDSICVPLFHTLRTRSLDFINAALRVSPLMAFLTDGTRQLQAMSSELQPRLNNLRDGLRDKLSEIDSVRFPRYGPEAIGVFEILSCMVGSTSIEAIGRLVCTHCHNTRLEDVRELGHYAMRSKVQIMFDVRGLDRRCDEGSRPKICFQDWLWGYYLNSFWPYTLAPFSPTTPCSFCSSRCPTTLRLQVTRAPIFFFIDVSDWDLETNPEHVLDLPMVDNTRLSYRLCAAIYFGVNHWTCRWISSNGHVWNHDGQKHRGILQSDGRLVEPFGRSKFCSLRTSDYSTLSVLIYALDT